MKAYAAGIVSGIGDQQFAPDQTTNREQIATMIYRAVTYIEQQSGKTFAEKNADLSAYTDRDSVSDWAAEGVGVLASNGIMKGTSDTTLSPRRHPARWSRACCWRCACSTLQNKPAPLRRLPRTPPEKVPLRARPPEGKAGLSLSGQARGAFPEGTYTKRDTKGDTQKRGRRGRKTPPPPFFPPPGQQGKKARRKSLHFCGGPLALAEN